MMSQSIAFVHEGIDPSLLRQNEQGQTLAEFLVSDMHCAGCIAKVERTTRSIDGVVAARANLTTRRLSVTLSPGFPPERVLSALLDAGREARPFDPAILRDNPVDRETRQLVSAMAVAGFASANIMLLSVSVWSGAEGATRDMFHWLSALIALPTIAYSGRPFFSSAWRALRHGRTNMDVPIAIGVLGATALSLYETATSGRHAWFDGSVMLLFFLLVGRLLDHRMRAMAHASAARLLSLTPSIATLVQPGGILRHISITAIQPGDVIRALPGERIAIDGEVVHGSSDVDRAILTGESVPEAVQPGCNVHAGVMNLTGMLDIRATARSSQTLLADIVRLMEKVERPDGKFVRMADRASRLYTPVVHAAALATLCGWLLLGNAFHPSLTAAIAVLIITCPCALGLAVPAVQVVAAGRLLGAGIILKDGAGLEKLSEVDFVVLDKTGTLTAGRPVVVSAPPQNSESWLLAAALATGSRHPLSQCLSQQAINLAITAPQVDDLVEIPGHGVEARYEGRLIRLGRPGWVVDEDQPLQISGTEVWLSVDGQFNASFGFSDALRADAARVVAQLQKMGMPVMLLSGDAQSVAEHVAAEAGIDHFVAECLPGDKVATLQRLARDGHKVLMIGDGLNDAPALAAAHVSMSPASGADITQAAADLVFTGEQLEPVVQAIVTAKAARRKIYQNFVLSIGYNVIAVPIAVLGFATPLIAAVSMSASSIIVVGNALTLNLSARRAAKRRFKEQSR
ncbi:cadmium-translocating P-type ATPase [Aureimonas fodinaquatilis]|uniref:Cadmium-translocating P-type ATPase n=1 Tax=Aureimonas fodinaquatilis TaxID=2565783 RepID=A0A5B0E237_9HYPH|nr:heavy metal translocating P-type ATPase [Aureimonas fodinaquatilis]KAA0971800.1 cadmium-translocating P-type ATPase [Aureimonas fodinaquatilis]